MFGHSEALKCTSSTLASLLKEAPTSPRDLHIGTTSLTVISRGHLLVILTAVVLGQSILSITKCRPKTLIDGFASARSLPDSVWKQQTEISIQYVKLQENLH